jgi:hypothetical protein
VCTSGTNDSYGSGSGGRFYVSKVDANGVASGTDDKFPDVAPTLPKRAGSVEYPVIRMNYGGDQSITAPGKAKGCSLYGLMGSQGNEDCPLFNEWSFTAQVAAPTDDNNQPLPGYFVRWRLSRGSGDGQGGEEGGDGIFDEPSERVMPGDAGADIPLNGGEITLVTSFSTGRWFPRLEVWGPQENDEGQTESALLGYAEIHSLVVELKPSANVKR